MRPRKKDRHLPSCIYLNHGAYYFVRAGKWRPLGRDFGEALAEYARITSQPKGGMAELIDMAFSQMRPRLSKSTISQYIIAGNKLKKMLVEFSPEQVRPKHVAQIKVAMAATPNMANRVLSFLRQVFDYALEQQLIESNPAIGIRRHKEAKRGRLVTAEEFTAIRAQAVPRMQTIMDLLYLTGQRVGDVLMIKRTDLTDNGIMFVQQKTGARLIVRWTPALRAVVAAAGELTGNVRAFTLLHNRRGKPPDYRTTKLQWDTACTLASITDAHLHDIRAMSLTATKRQGRDATALAGHTAKAQTERYLRDREIPVVDGPIFGT